MIPVPAPPLGARVRVGTYNLYLGADLSLLLGPVPPDELPANIAEVLRQLETTAFPQRAAAIARLLVREQLDLVGLQEVCTWHSDGKVMWDCTRDLCRALEELGEPYDVVHSHLSFDGSGVVEQAGRPVEMRLEGRNVVLRRRRSGVRVEETAAGTFGSSLTTSLLGAIELSIMRGWCAARCTVDGATAPFTFVNTHTEAYDAGSRDRQRAELVDTLPDDPRIVLVGDFNAIPDQVGMPAGLIDAWELSGNPVDGPGAATCCQVADLRNAEPALTERIDYVWLRGLSAESAARFGADQADRTERGLWPSDHAGVVATLLVD